MKTNFDIENFAVPNAENPYNYLLDTTVFNRFAENESWLEIAIRSLSFDFCYYKTANQDYELSGQGAKTYDANCVSHPHLSEKFLQKIPVFMKIEKQLYVKRVSSMASLMTNHWVLDGTYHIYDDKSGAGILTKKILEFNEKLRKKHPFAQHYDAMTAEAAIYNHCILVTDDEDLRNLVNEDFPQRAISTEELITTIIHRRE